MGFFDKIFRARDEKKIVKPGQLDIIAEGKPVSAEDARLNTEHINRTFKTGIAVVEAMQLELLMNKLADWADAHDVFIPEIVFTRGDMKISLGMQRIPKATAKEIDKTPLP